MISLLVAAAVASADTRVSTIGYRLQVANVALCGEVEPLAGFVIHHASQYAPKARRALGLGALPVVLAVVPGSPAAGAGLRAGDAIDAIGGVAANVSPDGRMRYDVVAALNARIGAGLAQPPLRLRVAGRDVSFTGERGCAAAIELVPGRKVNAQADGRIVQIWGGLAEFARNDDALAFSIAHELAHNILKHRARLDAIGWSRANSRAVELEADRLAVWLVARAGYDVDAIVPYRARLNAKFGGSATHPPPAERIARLAEAVAAVKAQRAAGAALIPAQ